MPGPESIMNLESERVQRRLSEIKMEQGEVKPRFNLLNLSTDKVALEDFVLKMSLLKMPWIRKWTIKVKDHKMGSDESTSSLEPQCEGNDPSQGFMMMGKANSFVGSQMWSVYILTEIDNAGMIMRNT
ncbi:hypothetical protein Tco_0268023 [Tanacetum coccineum]